MKIKPIQLGRWVFGVVALAAVIIAVNHLGETEYLLRLLRGANPAWLALALLLQIATYVCASFVMQIALRNGEGNSDGNGKADGESCPSIISLFSLSVAKQFVAQSMPSIGLSGNFLIVKGLENRGVPRQKAIFAVLVNLLSYYITFSIAITVAVGLLWWLRDLRTGILVSFTILLALIVSVSLIVFWMGRNAGRGLPNWIRGRIITSDTDELFDSASASSPWEIRRIIRASVVQSLTFASDAATFYCVLLSLNVNANPLVVLASFITATAVAAIGLVPGGLGTFEGTAVAMLHSHGLSIETALAGTLLFRGFTFWLPMIPGLWLSRRELHMKSGAAMR